MPNMKSNQSALLKNHNEIPEIKAERFWTPDDVRRFCMNHDYYTCGTVKDYEALLDFVLGIDNPSPDAVYLAAKNIFDHSDIKNTSIENIMCMLANEAIHTIYDVK